MTEATEVWYRYDMNTYAAPVDEFDNPVGVGRTTVTLYTYKVLRHTPKGVWIDITGIGDRRFIRRDARKRFACPTREEAIESFRARKARQMQILRSGIARIEQALQYLERYPDEKPIHMGFTPTMTGFC